MTEKRVGSAGKGADVFHLPKQSRSKSLREEILQEIASSFDGHFRQQNELVRQANAELSDQVQRLMVGIDRLVSEMSGVRTGTKQEAFAKVGAADAPADLPTVGGEAALFYTFTAADIAEALGGFRASEIGVLLGARGLRWAGNSDYQELDRHKKTTLTKFWHEDIVQKID